MLMTFLVLAYGCITALSVRMTFKEFRAAPSDNPLWLCSGLLACLAWPLAVVVMLLMVNLQTPMPHRSEPAV